MGEAVCIASGPSLTESDVELVRQWRLADPTRFVIVANTTFRLAPWADALFAMDNKWWSVYGKEAKSTFKGELLCTGGSDSRLYAKTVLKRHRFLCHGNTGAAILSYCATGDYSRIIMLGYDCALKPGRKHWHQDHPRPLGNAGSIHRWPRQFDNVKNYYKDANIVNASRETALKTWPRLTLEQALGIEQVKAA